MNFEARFEARQGGRTRGLDEDLKRVKFDKLTTKTMSGDVGFSASEGLKELLNLEAFQKPTESHPVSSFATQESDPFAEHAWCEDARQLRGLLRRH